MISVIITAKNESNTIIKAVSAFLNQAYIANDFEIIVIAPDDATLDKVKNLSPNLKTIKDKGQGKPAALNLGLKQAQGDWLIFSDGDVEVELNAVAELIKSKADAITGQPISINDINNKFGFWQYVLVSSAHELRQRKSQRGEFIILSGYLFAVKASLLKNFSFPQNTLAEDEYLSYYLWYKGHKITYAPEAKVKVKFPDNYRDWVKQKSRTLGATYQIPTTWKQGTAMRSFGKEAISAFGLLKYVHNLKELFWLKLLFLARLHVWLNAWFKVKILKQNRNQVWVRIESTK